MLRPVADLNENKGMFSMLTTMQSLGCYVPHLNAPQAFLLLSGPPLVPQTPLGAPLRLLAIPFCGPPDGG